MSQKKQTLWDVRFHWVDGKLKPGIDYMDRVEAEYFAADSREDLDKVFETVTAAYGLPILRSAKNTAYRRKATAGRFAIVSASVLVE